LKNEPVGVF